MVAVDLNSPVKHAGAQRLSKKKELLQMVDLDLNPPKKHAGLVPVRLPVRLGKLINKTLTTDKWDTEHGRSTEAEQKERTTTTGRSRPESPNEARRLSAS